MSKIFLMKALSKLLPVFAVLLAWEIVSQLGIVNSNLFPPPSEVIVAFRDWLESGNFQKDLQASLWRMLVGFLIGGILGIFIGILTGRSFRFAATINPILNILRSLPPVAIIPVIIVWFGIDNTAKVFSISFAVFFPVWINTYWGALNIPIDYLRSAKLLSTSRLELFIKVLFPATIPSIIAGLRTSIPIAYIMVYVSEVAGASEGIGYRIDVTHLAYRLDTMLAALIFLALLGAMSDWLFTRLVLHFFPWIPISKNNE